METTKKPKNLTKKQQRQREGNARGGKNALKDQPEARAERARKGGRSCLALYGRDFFKLIAKRRHQKKKEPTDETEVVAEDSSHNVDATVSKALVQETKEQVNQHDESSESEKEQEQRNQKRQTDERQ